LELVTECAKIALTRGLSLDFSLIGQVDPTATPVELPFRQTGPYDNANLPGLLAQFKPHLVWFPSRTPETYCFTLGSALQAGLPIVAPDLGALPERIGGLNWAWITPPAWGADRMTDFFMRLRESNFRPHLAPPAFGALPDAAQSFYEAEYLHPREDCRLCSVRVGTSPVSNPVGLVYG
jgi:glycosyltransferase involved in cell wall biosynthesis